MQPLPDPRDAGRLTSAIDLAQQGIDIYDRMGLTLRLANGRYALGIALTRAGRLGEALAQLAEALTLFHDNRQPLWEGVTHFRLAEAHLAARRPRWRPRTRSRPSPCAGSAANGGGPRC